jgi:hypothetical protein
LFTSLASAPASEFFLSLLCLGCRPVDDLSAEADTQGCPIYIEYF